jgi:hypothetical protein
VIIAARCYGMVRRTHQPCSKTPCTNVCSARDTINPENSLARSYDEAVSEKWHTTERQFLSWRVVRFGSLARPPCGRWYGLRPPL